jgi:copper chaperone
LLILFDFVENQLVNELADNPYLWRNIMNSKTILVPGISCGHCTNTIQTEIGELDGVVSVSAEVETRKVAITWEDPASWQQIDQTLHEIGFPPQQLIQL